MDSTLYNPKNQGIQIQLRYYRDSLAISGGMVIVMSIWDIIKLFIGFFLGEDTIKELVEATIYENGISAIGTKYESTMRALTWVSILLILSIFVAIIFLYHLYIGLNAYRVGRQTAKKSNRFFIVLTLLSTIFTGSLVWVPKGYILMYLAGTLAFSGIVNIIGASEAKRIESSWKFKTFQGIVKIMQPTALHCWQDTIILIALIYVMPPSWWITVPGIG